MTTRPYRMAERIMFSVGLPPVPLRRNSETRSTTWRSKLKREYQEQVWCAGHAPASAYVPMAKYGNPWELPWERATVHYTWRSTHETDQDNVIASMKPALDVIKSTGPRPLGIIVDDAGAVVSATWEKVSKRADECVEIEIVRL